MFERIKNLLQCLKNRLFGVSMPRPKYVKKYVDKYRKLFSLSSQSTLSSGTTASATPLTPVPESSNGINLNAIEAYFNDRLVELQSMAVRGDAWFFGSCCTFIDMLAWAVFYDEIVNHNNQNRGRNGRSDSKFFNAFLKEYIFKSNSHYVTLRRSLGISEDGLADKFYQTLRCGVVHSFSMKQSMADGDGYDILLAHYHDFDDMSQHHLEVVDTYIERQSGQTTPIESIILVAESFVQDIRTAVVEMVKNARLNQNAPVVHNSSPRAKIEDNLINLFKNKPPMGFLNIDLVR